MAVEAGTVRKVKGDTYKCVASNCCARCLMVTKANRTLVCVAVRTPRRKMLGSTTSKLQRLLPTPLEPVWVLEGWTKWWVA